MTPAHFKKIIDVNKQSDLDWICKTHNVLVVRGGKWLPCKKDGHCVVGIYKRPVQLPLFVGAK